MGREDRRTERKLRKRRLHWLEKTRGRNELVNKVVSEMEENFDENEIEDAKAFFVDYFTWSGPFSQFGETIDYESLESISKDYGLELLDAEFIMDTVDDVFSKEKETKSQINEP